jgi:hypothetical protein
MWLMSRRRRMRTLGAAALLPLLLVSVAAGRHSLVHCQITGATSTESCCPELDKPDPDDRADGPGDRQGGSVAATIASAACCVRETIALVRPPSEPPASTPHDLGVPPLAFTYPADPLEGSGPGRAPRAAAREMVRSTPLLLVKRSLLI